MPPPASPPARSSSAAKSGVLLLPTSSSRGHSTGRNAGARQRLPLSRALSVALVSVLESSASMISVGSGPTRAAVLAPQPMDLRCGNGAISGISNLALGALGLHG